MQGSPDQSVSMATVVLPAIGEGQLVHFNERSRDAFGSSSGIVFTESAWKEDGGRIHVPSISSTGMKPRNLPVPEEFLQQQQQHQRVTDPGATRSHSSEALSALPSRATDSSYSSVTRHPLLRKGRADGGGLSPSDPPSNHSDLGDRSIEGEALLLPPRPSTISPRLSANSRESAADGASSSTGAARVFVSPLFGPPRTPEEARQGSNSSRHSRESHENARTTRGDRLLRREAQEQGHLATKKKPETRRYLDDDRRLIIGGGEAKQQVGGGAWNGRMSNVLSKSSVNISKDRELSTTTSAKTHEKPRLQKFRSDIDLTSKGLYDNQYTRHLYSNAPKSNAFTTSPASIQVRPTHLSPQVKGKQLPKQSQSHFRPRNRKWEEANAASDQRRQEPEMDAKKTERVLEWLQDVDGFADPPESPVIFDCGPEQSDTAIHVVYQGD